MKRPLSALVLLLAAALLPGCVTYLIRDNVVAERKESERTYYFNHYNDKATRIAKAGACAKAAEHFEDELVGKAQLSASTRNTTRFSKEDLEALDERIKSSARVLADGCLNDEAVKLKDGRRFERLSTLFRMLAILPLPEEEQKSLVLRADTTDLLRAEATAADAQKAWDAGKVYDALSGFMSAQSIASAVQAATEQEKAKYARLFEDRKRAHVDDMLKKAGEAARSPDTAHRAAVYLARAYEVTGDKALGKRLAVTREALLASHVYQWQVEWKGEPRITRAAKDVVQGHKFTGNLRASTPREFAAIVDVGDFTVTPREREGSRTDYYKTGTTSVDNPEYRKVNAAVIKQQGCVSALQPGMFSSSQSNDKVHKNQKNAGCASTCSSYDCARRQSQGILKDLEHEMSKTPMTLQEDVMSPWAYPTREWSQVIAAPVQLSLKHALDAAPKPSTMTLQHEYTDHSHDLIPQLGYGKKEIVKQSDADLAKSAGEKLGNQLVAELEKDYEVWFKATPKLGERGQVLFILLGGDARAFDRDLEAATGVQEAHRIVLR